MKRRATPVVAALAAGTTALTIGLATLPAHAAGSGRHALVSDTPSWANRGADRGTLPSTAAISAQVVLASKNPAGLQQYAIAVSTPGNALYQHYLTAAQARARFGAASGAASSVASWLRSQGLTVTGTTLHTVGFRGSVSSIDHAFGVTMHQFSVQGQTKRAPVGTLSVPTSLSSDVLAVMGLSTAPVAKPANVSAKPATHVAPTTTTTAAKTNAKAFPCSDYFGQKMATKYPKAYGKTQPFAVCGYQPLQLQGAYGLSGSGFTGKGITVAVIDEGKLPTMAKDLKQWNTNRNFQQFKKGQYTEYGDAGYNSGWAGEESLDIEAIHSVAPDANIDYFGSTNFYSSYNQIVDNDMADAVNNSYTQGLDSQQSQSTITSYEQTFQQGATEGIGFYFSSGDSGGQNGTVNYPCADPYVTCVGGSAVGITKTNGYGWETSWETDYTDLSSDGQSWNPAPPGAFTSGAGGGTSVVFDQPKYQKGVVPKKFSEANGKTPMRAVPDIGAEADPTTGFLQGYSSQVGGKFVYAEDRIGGTSLSSPLWVGFQADAEVAGGAKIGFANPMLYSKYGTADFNDVMDQGTAYANVRTRVVNGATVISLATAGQAKDTGLAAVKGYDTTTGIGTPTAKYFTSFGQ